MKIHHLRNATFVLETGRHFILVDPMLGERGKLPPFAYVRHKPRRNPTVPLPNSAARILENVTHCLITHSRTFGVKALQHTDHLDAAGESFLRTRNIPVVCPQKDAAYLKKFGLRVEMSLSYGMPQSFLCGQITAIPARHGHGWIHRLMANGAGFLVELPGEPSVYISGDTVYTEAVVRVLTEQQPDLAVVAAGNASLDVGGSILMTLEEVLTFIRTAPGKVIANHLEALNHCTITRAQLRQALEKVGLLSKTFIPQDGETMTIGLD